MTKLFLDTYGGPVEVTLTGKETTSPVLRRRYVEVAGWLKEPMFVSADRLVGAYTREAAEASFAKRTMSRSL